MSNDRRADQRRAPVQPPPVGAIARPEPRRAVHSSAETAPGDAPLRWIPSRTFRMGSEAFYPEEAPVRSVSVDGFWMEAHPVTNRDFLRFVDATGYRTVAERSLDPAEFPGAPAANLVAGSMVFVPTPGPVDLHHISQWWRWTPGACWARPEGPDSDVDDRQTHPVVHIAAEDAEAYAAWAGRELPTEAEWECAARGGIDDRAFIWGDEACPDGRRLAKFWEGDFPWRNRASDGHARTAPVGSFPANEDGLWDMAGNVWEWTADWYSDERPSDAEKPCCIPRNPRGSTAEASYDRSQPQFRIPRRVVKGGSFLCADEYCQRYRPAARRPQMIDTGMSHVGFRCIDRRPRSSNDTPGRTGS